MAIVTCQRNLKPFSSATWCRLFPRYAFWRHSGAVGSSDASAILRYTSASFAQVIDVMCNLDDVALSDINMLRKSLRFLARAVERIGDTDSPRVSDAIRECDLGPIACYLVMKASEHERITFGTLFASLIDGYEPVRLSTSLSTRVSGRGSSTTRLEHQLRVGLQVAHPVRGIGKIVDIDWDDDRDKPYVVLFDGGETHHYSEESATKLKPVGFNVEKPKQKGGPTGARPSRSVASIVSRTMSALKEKTPSQLRSANFDTAERAVASRGSGLPVPAHNKETVIGSGATDGATLATGASFVASAGKADERAAKPIAVSALHGTTVHSVAQRTGDTVGTMTMRLDCSAERMSDSESKPFHASVCNHLQSYLPDSSALVLDFEFDEFESPICHIAISGANIDGALLVRLLEADFRAQKWLSISGCR